MLITALSRLVYNGPRNWTTVRLISNQTGKIILEKDQAGVAILRLNNPPVNILDTETLQLYAKTLQKLEEDKSCRGLIIASASERAFCAGVNINVFCSGDRTKISSFWRSIQDLFYYTYRSRLATVAAINGAAIAGGCVIAISCDKRIMAKGGPKSLIGLNETKLGISTPFWLNDRTVELVGHRKAEYAIVQGLLYDAQQAFEFGYVDRVVEQNVLIDVARQELQQLLEIPDHTREHTKTAMRRPLIEKFLKLREKDIEDLTNMTCDPRTQTVVQEYLSSLTKRKRT